MTEREQSPCLPDVLACYSGAATGSLALIADAMHMLTDLVRACSVRRACVPACALVCARVSARACVPVCVRVCARACVRACRCSHRPRSLLPRAKCTRGGCGQISLLVGFYAVQAGKQARSDLATFGDHARRTPHAARHTPRTPRTLRTLSRAPACVCRRHAHGGGGRSYER